MPQNSDIYNECEDNATGLTLPQELTLGNESYCTLTSSTKLPIYSVVDKVFPLSQSARNVIVERI